MRPFLSIAILLLIVNCVFAQESAEDRTYMQETLSWLNAPYVEDIEKAKEDPFLADETSGYSSGKVYYLPGDIYKIFFFEGQDCNKGCNPIFYCTTMPAGKIMEEPYELDLEPITALHKIGEDYLVIQGADYKASIESMHCASASLLTYENNEPQFLKCFLEGENERSASDAQVKAFACSSTFVEEGTFFKFQPEKNKLSFRYQTYEDQAFVRDGMFMDVYGEYTFEDGYFVLHYQEIKDKKMRE